MVPEATSRVDCSITYCTTNVSASAPFSAHVLRHANTDTAGMSVLYSNRIIIRFSAGVARRVSVANITNLLYQVTCEKGVSFSLLCHSADLSGDVTLELGHRLLRWNPRSPSALGPCG